MFSPNQIVLSLGSNQGDRQATLQAATHLINKHLGSVVKISPIYETSSWGFESDSFYNCALLIHTSQSAASVLEKALEVEKKLGRNRDSQPGYAARIIDIDLICCNDEVISTSFLSLPHPLMHERKFVLQPAADLQWEWTHPLLKMNFEQLLQQCSDCAVPQIVGTLQNPMDEYHFGAVNFMAIEGNIGAGKTTLVHKISEDFNAKYILEGFADNPFLPKFYEDATRYAFPLEMSFLADRYSQLADDLAQFDLFKEFIVADYYIFKSLIFAQITLEEDEFKLYKQVFEIMYKETPKPGLYVYLYQNTPRLLANIKTRGRSYESDIQATYLDRVNQGYLNYIKTLPPKQVLLIDISDLDFVSTQEDYITILDAIQAKLDAQ